MAGIILGRGLANERRRYYATPPLIGRAHTQNDPCVAYHDPNKLLQFLQHVPHFFLDLLPVFSFVNFSTFLPAYPHGFQHILMLGTFLGDEEWFEKFFYFGHLTAAPFLPANLPRCRFRVPWAILKIICKVCIHSRLLSMIELYQS